MSALLESEHLHSSFQHKRRNVCFLLRSETPFWRSDIWIRTKMDVNETLFVPMNRYWTIRKQVRRRAERAEKERGERWRQVSGIVQGWPAQEEAQTQPHHLHHLPAAWAGACLREVPLPRRLQPWRTRHEGEPPRGPSSGRRKFSITPAKCMSVHEVCVSKSPCLQPAVFAFSFCCLIFMVEEGSFLT